MNLRQKILLGISVLVLSGCVYQNFGNQKRDMFGNAPQCRQETTVAIYDKQGKYEVPGCADYTYNDNSLYDFGNGQQYDDFDTETDFPDVPDNKNNVNQVVMENLNTRVLAYCRGTQDEIDACVQRLEGSCYVRITDIPSLPAKYDQLKRGTYPTRRWRNGETVPRW